jgi:hypothetical protein
MVSAIIDAARMRKRPSAEASSAECAVISVALLERARELNEGEVDGDVDEEI